VTVERVTKAKAVVTGWGLASAIGLEEGEVWEALKNGKSGVKIWPGYIYRNAPLPVGACDLERIEGELRKAGIELEHKEQRALVLALYVLNQALQQSPPQGEERKRILYVASSLTTSELLSERWGVYFSGGKNPASSIIEAANCYFAARLSRAFPIFGPVVTISSSCASAIQAITYAMRDLALGVAEEAVVVGVDSALTKPMLDTWMSTRILSRLKPYETAARPFCKTRRGFVYAEGAGCVVLRRESPQAKLALYGSDFHGSRGSMIALEEAAITRSMAETVRDAGLTPQEIGFIHANANGSPAGDAEEARAISTLFGPHVPVYTSKSLYGNAHGAAGIINLIHSGLILTHDYLPPNFHIYERDETIAEQINCYYAPRSSFSSRFGLLNTFGFGGMNASLVFGREGE